MKTRLFSRVVALCLLLIAGGLGFNSCKPDLVDAPAGAAEFGSIRVMNFVECAVPFDIFIYQPNSLDTVINRALEYSVGSAYATNLVPGTYKVQARRLNRTETIAEASVIIAANDAKTVMFFGKGNVDPFEVKVEPDQNITPAADKVYVRFINTKTNVGNVDLVFENPLNTPPAEFANRPAKALSNYVELGHALDTTYAMYVIKSDTREVISRVAGAAFGPGQFYTIVYGGNDNDCRDTAAAKADTLRIRYFDDNQQGNDLTFPVVQSLRFNFINGLIPPPDAAPGQRTYSTAGVVINNDDRFLIPTISPMEMAREISIDENGIINGGFYTVPWTDAIQVSMYANVYGGDGSPTEANAILNQRGIKLVDLRAGNRKLVESDVPFSIIVLDTVSNRLTNGIYNVDSSKIVSWSVPLPDVPVVNKAQIVVINALAPVRGDGAQRPSRYAKFYVNGTVPKAFTAVQSSPKSDVVEVDAGSPVEIKVDIGRSSVFETVTKTFTPESGGIYEAVLLGQRGNPNGHHPQLKIIHTNKKSQ
jgi:hypothetical protein